MTTTTDYLTQLQTDKQTLADNLVTKGVEATHDETFTELVPKVLEIQSGGGDFSLEQYMRSVDLQYKYSTSHNRIYTEKDYTTEEVQKTQNLLNILGKGEMVNG